MTKTFVFAILAAASLSARAEVFEAPDLGLRIDAPAGFARVPADIVAAKWKEPQNFVIGNEGATTTITADLKKDAVRPEQIGALEKAMVGLMPKVMPGLQIVRHEVVKIDGRQWAELEMTSKGQDMDIRNIMLATSMSGRMLVVNFNSTERDFPSVETALRKSIASVKVSKP